MKLRNKKTGEVKEFGGDRLELTEYYKENGGGIKNVCSYHSLAELNEDWEDYKPSEPLIKDEKIRKAIKAWAELFNFKDNIRYMPFQEMSGHYLYHLSCSIDIPDIEGLKEYHYYSIAELCGEEEETYAKSN